MHYLFEVTKYIHVILTVESHLRDKQGNRGHSGVDVSKPAGYVVCDGNMSSFSFFFLLSVNISIYQRPYVGLCLYLVTITSLQTRTFDMTSLGSEVT